MQVSVHMQVERALLDVASVKLDLDTDPINATHMSQILKFSIVDLNYDVINSLF